MVIKIEVVSWKTYFRDCTAAEVAFVKFLFSWYWIHIKETKAPEQC